MVKTINLLTLLEIACITGFVGDVLLQLGVKNNYGGSTGWGLKSYFELHGSAESTFIAGGMMTLFYILFYLSRLSLNYLSLAVFGIVIDYLFRALTLFKSLDGYYQYFNYVWSAVWMAIPMCLPFFIYEIFV